MKSLVLLFLYFFSSLSFAADRFQTMHVKDLDSAQGSVIIFDANNESTRAHEGTIPGAKLLASSEKADVLQALPKDKNSKLVFYCSNTMCTASHQAAEYAIDAGYKNVSVMVDGIYGWRDAHKPVAMEPKTVLKMMKAKNAVVFDVREAEERHEVIAKVQWMPMSKLNNPNEWSSFVKNLPKDKTVVFHCAAGGRAKKMAEKLSEEGFKTAFFKSPDQWHEAGLPVKQGPAK